MPLVVICGPVANKPFNGGAAWTRLSWALGFRELGWKVFLLECIAAEACVDATGTTVPIEESVNLAFFRHVVRFGGLQGSAALVRDDGSSACGAPMHELLQIAESADLLINISGHLTGHPLFNRFRRRVFLDLDPGFTQLWHAAGVLPALNDHHFFFTVGENIGTADCSIPTCGIDWQAIRQPVVLDDWPVCDPHGLEHFTTVASWRGPYGPIQHNGVTLGPKVHEFRKFITLPERAVGSFELALDIHPGDGKDLALLHQHGWHIREPRSVAGTPELFRTYIHASDAEFSVAQGMYVHTNSGWFSDRTVRYLASGKPSLVQDTGFTGRYPSGTGLVSFATLDEAVDGAEFLRRDYKRHARAARALAEEHFAAPKVLGGLLNRLDFAS